nr:glycosyltransferase family 2 protein [Alkalilimnicola ehrlichii]
MATTDRKIAVIIPYFQRQPGLLRQCVRSVLDTKGDVDPLIIIVDDGSPIPAQDEVGDLHDGISLTIIRQKNSGPAAARNTGLDHVSGGTRFATFLDSDDCWVEQFLPDAVWALQRECELFIGNTRRKGSKPRFSWSKDSSRNIEPHKHTLINQKRDIYNFRGDFFDLMVFRSNLVSATAMAYRIDKFPSLRFPEHLFQGEDRLFKLRLSKRLKSIAFSPKVYAEEGEGVNVLDKSGWQTEGHLRLTSSYIKMSTMILNEIDLTSRQRGHVCRELSEFRRAFVATILHNIRHRKPLNWGCVRSTLRHDPYGAAFILPNVIRILGKKAIGAKNT